MAAAFSPPVRCTRSKHLTGTAGLKAAGSPFAALPAATPGAALATTRYPTRSPPGKRTVPEPAALPPSVAHAAPPTPLPPWFFSSSTSPPEAPGVSRRPPPPPNSANFARASCAQSGPASQLPHGGTRREKAGLPAGRQGHRSDARCPCHPPPRAPASARHSSHTLQDCRQSGATGATGLRISTQTHPSFGGNAVPGGHCIHITGVFQRCMAA